MSDLTLVANPGSASRKYALFEGPYCRVQLHFEYNDKVVVCTLHRDLQHTVIKTNLKTVAQASKLLVSLLHKHDCLAADETITAVGLRVVAPSSHFLEDRLIDKATVRLLGDLKPLAPLHIGASLEELHRLRSIFKSTPIYGISDSSFHNTKPAYAQHYGLPLKDADRLDIKRFGYHGLAVASTVHQLKELGKLTPKLVVVHLGSGASVTAVKNGKSIDNTMGYSPLEGLIMATRSGSLDVTAARVLQTKLALNDKRFDEYLNQSSGLLGLGGSADMRDLLRQEQTGDQRARLALNTYVYAIQKAVGAMTAVLGGIDQLVFTGTIGERAYAVRQQIIHHLLYLDFDLDHAHNNHCLEPTEPIMVSRVLHSKPIYVIPVDEAAEIARRTRHLVSK
jgi:acetate kinase